MNMTTVIRCLSVAAVVVMTGCADSHSDNKEKEENHGHEEHGNEIVIKHEQIEKLGIKTTIVNPSEFQNVMVERFSHLHCRKLLLRLNQTVL